MSWQDIENDKEKYNAYLCSREWCEKREQVRARAFDRCERCFLNPMEACHHLTYDRKYEERLEDLQGICNACHAFTHGKSDQDPSGTSLSLTPWLVDLDHYSLFMCPRCCSADGLAIVQQRAFNMPVGLAINLEVRCKCKVRFDVRFLNIGDRLGVEIVNIKSVFDFDGT